MFNFHKIKKPIIYTLLTFALIAALFWLAYFSDTTTIRSTKENSLWVELDQSTAERNKILAPSFAPLVQRISGAVLVILSSETVFEDPRPTSELGPLPSGALSPFLGPQGQGAPRVRKGMGSGFIIHPSGYALTNNHVIENATIKVKVGSEAREYEAEVIGTDSFYDVALIRILSKRRDWPVIPLGSSAQCQVGDPALAFGNPLALELSVTSGIISARGRRQVHPSGRFGFFDFIQTDTPINPGSSGGPLVNVRGEAIGINTAMAGGYGIGFTIPIDQVKPILHQLKEFGKAIHSFIGVDAHDLTENMAKEFGLSGTQGAHVRSVEADSPAAKAGIKTGDVIIEFDGELILDANSLQLKAAIAKPGKSVVVKVLRKGKTISLNVTPMLSPDEYQEEQAKIRGFKGKIVSIESVGLSATTLDDAARKILKLNKNIEGARVIEVVPYSPAARYDIHPNDVIIKVNNEPINTVQQLSDAIKTAPRLSAIFITALRHGSQLLFVIEKP